MGVDVATNAKPPGVVHTERLRVFFREKSTSVGYPSKCKETVNVRLSILSSTVLCSKRSL
jgi:hypothetical protein